MLNGVCGLKVSQGRLIAVVDVEAGKLTLKKVNQEFERKFQ